jgi:cytochrome c2
MDFPTQRRSTARAIVIILAAASGLTWAAAPTAAPTATPPTAAPTAANTAPDGARAYREECAACHIAFPTRLLPATSWRAVMAGLGKHFGVDASLDTATSSAISAYLEQNAGYPRRGDSTGAQSSAGTQPLLRITETNWFRREHHELTPAALQRKGATSAADCSACHAGAARGEFEDEHGERGERRGRGDRGERSEYGEHGSRGHERD